MLHLLEDLRDGQGWNERGAGAELIARGHVGVRGFRAEVGHADAPLERAARRDHFAEHRTDDRRGQVTALAVQPVEDLFLARRNVDAAPVGGLRAADRPCGLRPLRQQAQQLIVDAIDLAPEPVDGVGGHRRKGNG